MYSTLNIGNYKIKMDLHIFKQIKLHLNSRFLLPLHYFQCILFMPFFLYCILEWDFFFKFYLSIVIEQLFSFYYCMQTGCIFSVKKIFRNSQYLLRNKRSKKMLTGNNRVARLSALNFANIKSRNYLRRKS